MPWKSKDYLLNGFSVKTSVLVKVYNQQFQGSSRGLFGFNGRLDFLSMLKFATILHQSWKSYTKDSPLPGLVARTTSTTMFYMFDTTSSLMAL